MLCCGAMWCGCGGRVGVLHTTPHTAKAAPVVECSTALYTPAPLLCTYRLLSIARCEEAGREVHSSPLTNTWT